MSNVTHALGNSGPGVPFYALNQEWSFALLGPGIRAEYSSWARTHVQRLLDAQRGEYTPERFEEERRALRFDIRAGHYSWGSPLESVEAEEGLAPNALGRGVRDLLQSEVGRYKLVQLLLRPRHGEVDFKTIKALSEADPEGFNDATSEAIWLYPNLPAPEQVEAMASAPTHQRPDLLNQLTDEYATQLAQQTGQSRRELWALYRQWKTALTGTPSTPGTTGTTPTPESAAA